MTAIKQTLAALLGDIRGNRDTEILDSGNLLQDYGLDSLEAVELIARLERRYGLTFGADPDDMDALASLDALAAWVEVRVSRSSG